MLLKEEKKNQIQIQFKFNFDTLSNYSMISGICQLTEPSAELKKSIRKYWEIKILLLYIICEQARDKIPLQNIHN